MLYCISDAYKPVNFLYCGNLVSNGGFLHEKRLLNEFVFIIVNEGTLHINQNGHPLDIHSGESLLLFPGQLHYGYKPSHGRLSYFWTHFTMSDPNYKIYNRNALFRHNIQLKRACLIIQIHLIFLLLTTFFFLNTEACPLKKDPFPFSHNY